jgi:hypothetical protein
MIADVSETPVVISTECNDGTDDVMISIPKREQTNEEVSRTQKFAEECIELLKHVPECRLPFNKFIPAYHKHFGRQCRVADYGFTKLIELFEAISNIIEITEDPGGKRILQPMKLRDTVSKDNNNSEKQVQNELFFDYQTITPHEIKVLDLMGESSWTLMGFRNYLLEQENSFNLFKSEGQFENFIKNRPKLFRWTETYIWRRIDLKPLEKQILDLMGDSIFEIETLTRVLQ